MSISPYDQTISPWGVKIPFADHLGITLVEATRERCIVSITRRPELLNSWGSAHGGVVMTMLDLVMSLAVRAHYGVGGGVATIDMSIGFINPGVGTVLAEGRVLQGGRSTAFCESEARDEGGQLLAKAIGTFKLLGDKKPQLAE
jgi:uncharacterized protein (TIGR00369 family)